MIAKMNGRMLVFVDKELKVERDLNTWNIERITGRAMRSGLSEFDEAKR